MYSLVPHCIVALLFIASLLPFLSSKIRAKTHFGAHALLGVLYLLVPGVFLGATVTGDFNSLHSFMQSFVAAVHLSLAFHLYFPAPVQWNSKSLIFARVFTSFISLLVRLFAAYHLSEKSTRGLLISDQFILCSVLADGVWFVSELVRFAQSKRTIQEEVDVQCKRTTLWLEGKGSFYLENVYYIDATLSLLIALLHFAFPQQILKLIIKPEFVLDSHHIMWCRMFGSYALLAAISSLNARELSPSQQVQYLASRVIHQVTVFFLNVWGHWVLGVYSPNHISAFMISGFYMSFLFSSYFRARRNFEQENSDEIVDHEDTETVTRMETRTSKTKAH